MKTHKRLILILSLLMLVALQLNVQATEFISDKLNNLVAGEPTLLTSPISYLQIMGSYTHVDEETGDTIVYAASSGPPANFFAYNVDTGETLFNKSLINPLTDKGVKVVYGVDMGPDGIIYINTQGNAEIYTYNLQTDELKSHGEIYLSVNGVRTLQTASMHKGGFDSQGNYYVGTYPSGGLAQFNVKEEKIVDLGSHAVSGAYARVLGTRGDNIYIGGNGVQKDKATPGKLTADFVKYNAATNKFTTLPNPELPGYFKGADVENYYAGSTAGNRWLFTRARIKSAVVDQYYLCIFDMETEEWVDYIPGTLHLHLTELEDTDGDGVPDSVYFHEYISGVGAIVSKYNPFTKKISRNMIPIPKLTYLVNPRVVELKNQVHYPGKTIVAGSEANGIALVNLTLYMANYITDAPRNHTVIRTLRGGRENELMLSAYMGDEVFLFDTQRDRVSKTYSSRQIEGIAYIDGRYYTGMYDTGASLRSVDPRYSSNPSAVANLPEYEQNRAFVITDADDHILWGTVPNYGKLGGMVGIYHKASRTARGYRNVVPNQSISGLAYKDGKIYGSSNIYGGLGTAFPDVPAQIFRMDLATGAVELRKELHLKTDYNRQYFAGEMVWAPDGNLLVACVKTILVVNPDDLSIIKEIPIGGYRLTTSSTRWLPYRLIIGADGLLYTNISGQISAIDLETYEVKKLAQVNAGTGMEVSTDGDIYFIHGSNQTQLWKLELQR